MPLQVGSRLWTGSPVYAAMSATPGPERVPTICCRLAMSMTRSIARPVTSGPCPYDHLTSVATNLTFLEGRAWNIRRPTRRYAFRTATASSGSTPNSECVVSVDEDVSESYSGGEADDMYSAMLSLAQTLCQGWDGLVSELAGIQIQPPVGTYRVADHVTHHRHSRGLGVVDEVTQDVSDPPAAAP